MKTKYSYNPPWFRRWYAVFVGCCLTVTAMAQVPTHYAEQPIVSKAGVYPTYNEVKEVHVNINANKSALEVEDLQRRKDNQPYRFAVSGAVDIDAADGEKYISSGGEVWKLKITSKEATSLSLIFDEFELPEHAVMYLYNEERTMLMGPITATANNKEGTFGTDVIQGSSVIIEYYDPYGSIEQAGFHISKIAHGYRGLEGMNQEKEYGDSDDCNNDIRCAVGGPWCVEARAVSLILLNDGTEWCTGTMLNNTAEDLTPFFLTADHCLGGNNTWQFRFHYKNPTCGATAYAGTYWTFNNSILRANSADTDFALLELTGYDPFNNWHRLAGLQYAGWNRGAAAPANGIGIHHPNGDVMKISFEWHLATSAGWPFTPANSHWDVDFDDGTVEHGSSGSPLFDQNHRVVGQLHGTQDPGFTGDNYCESHDSRYGRFDQSWTGEGTAATRLSNWLDAGGTGAMTTNAISPLIIYHNREENGAEHYTATNNMELAGNVGGYPVMPPPPFPQFWWWPINGEPFEVLPGADVIYQAGTEVSIQPGVHIQAGSDFHAFVSPVNCGDGLDYGYSVLESMPEGGESTYSELEKENVSTTINEAMPNGIVSIYPNPNAGQFTIALNGLEEAATVDVMNMLGATVYTKGNVRNAALQVNISNQPKGVYFVKVTSNGKVFTEKIVHQ